MREMWGRRSVRYLSEIDCQQVRAGCGLIPGGGLGGRGRGSDPLDHSGMKIERMQSVSHHDQNSFRFPEGVNWSWRPPTRSTLNCQPQLSTSPSCQCPRWGCSSPPCFAGDQGVWRFTRDLRGIMYVFLFFFLEVYQTLHFHRRRQTAADSCQPLADRGAVPARRFATRHPARFQHTLNGA